MLTGLINTFHFISSILDNSITSKFNFAKKKEKIVNTFFDSIFKNSLQTSEFYFYKKLFYQDFKQ